MIHSYDDFITAAMQQPQPQRLLFVFCRAELPRDATDDEKRQFERGEGGALTPSLCVDKSVDEAKDFSALVDESRHTGQDWEVVFVAALSGRAGHPPSSDEAQQPLQMMVTSIHSGGIASYLAFNRDGDLLSFQ